MVGAVLERIHSRTAGEKFARHPCVQTRDVRLGIVSVRNTSLIRHDEYEDVRLIARAHRVDGSGHPLNLLGQVDVAMIDVEHTVAIEKDGWPSYGRGNHEKP
jgi:hypothetical protein